MSIRQERRIDFDTAALIMHRVIQQIDATDQIVPVHPHSWVRIGRQMVDDIVEGLENAPAALVGLLAGTNRGKRMVRVAPDPA